MWDDYYCLVHSMENTNTVLKWYGLLEDRGFIFLIGMITSLIIPWWLSWLICFAWSYHYYKQYYLGDNGGGGGSNQNKNLWDSIVKGVFAKGKENGYDSFSIPTQYNSNL